MEAGDLRVRYWLFKSEPATFSWDDLVARGAAGEEWDGVRSYQARNVMREMAAGDRGFFYHSQTERACVGTVDVLAASHPDSTDDTGTWDCVDIRAIAPLPRPVGLSAIKADAALSGMALVRLSRLSVQPVTAQEWRVVCMLGGVEP